MYGEQICDYIWTTNKILSSSEIANTKPITFEPTWTTETMLMALFNDTLDSGSAESSLSGIINWSVYRQKTGDSRLYFVETVDVSTTNLIDYNVANQTSYTYHVFPITATTVGGVVSSNPTLTCWWNWSLTGILPRSTEGMYYTDTNNIWIFKGNIASGSQEQNINKTIYEGFTQYLS